MPVVSSRRNKKSLLPIDLLIDQAKLAKLGKLVRVGSD